MSRVLLWLFLLVVVRLDQIEGCTGNAIPWELVDDEPTLVAQTENGKKFTVGTQHY